MCRLNVYYTVQVQGKAHESCSSLDSDKLILVGIQHDQDTNTGESDKENDHVPRSGLRLSEELHKPSLDQVDKKHRLER